MSRLRTTRPDSTLAFDLGAKARLYARASIEEYWVLDVSKAQLDVAVFGHKRLAHFPQTQKGIVAFCEHLRGLQPLLSGYGSNRWQGDASRSGSG